MPQPRIVYQDVAPNAKEESAVKAVNGEKFIDCRSLKKEETQVPEVITLEKNIWKLDGTRKPFPDKPELFEWGVLSSTISGEDGYFLEGEIPELTITFSGLQTSIALSFDFDLYNREYVSQLCIAYYRDGVLMDEDTYYPDCERYACTREIEYYNKIIIRFLRTSTPHRRARIFNLFYGITRIFTVDELQEVSALEEINPISTEISINTMNFSVRNTSGIPFLFQKMQPVSLFYGDQLIGKYFIDDSKRKNMNFYSINTIDSVGILDKTTFYGGMYENKCAAELIEEVLQNTNIEYEIESWLQDKTVSGYIPICTSREALLQIAFVTGAVVDTSRSKKLMVKQLDKSIQKEFDESNTYLEENSVEIAGKVTSVLVTAYSYSKGNETTEIYKGVLPQGDNLMRFDSAYHSYSVSGGTMVKESDNFVIIRADGISEVILCGGSYVETKTVYSKVNPNVKNTDVENSKKVEACTLVNTTNALEVLERLYDYYLSSERIVTKLLLEDAKAGDTVRLLTNFSEIKTGIITSNNMTFGSKLTGKVEALGINI